MLYPNSILWKIQLFTAARKLNCWNIAYIAYNSAHQNYNFMDCIAKMHSNIQLKHTKEAYFVTSLSC